MASSGRRYSKEELRNLEKKRFENSLGWRIPAGILTLGISEGIRAAVTDSDDQEGRFQKAEIEKAKCIQAERQKAEMLKAEMQKVERQKAEMMAETAEYKRKAYENSLGWRIPAGILTLGISEAIRAAVTDDP